MARTRQTASRGTGGQIDPWVKRRVSKRKLKDQPWSTQEISKRRKLAAKKKEAGKKLDYSGVSPCLDGGGVAADGENHVERFPTQAVAKHAAEGNPVAGHDLFESEEDENSDDRSPRKSAPFYEESTTHVEFTKVREIFLGNLKLLQRAAMEIPSVEQLSGEALAFVVSIFGSGDNFPAQTSLVTPLSSFSPILTSVKLAAIAHSKTSEGSYRLNLHYFGGCDTDPTPPGDSNRTKKVSLLTKYAKIQYARQQGNSVMHLSCTIPVRDSTEREKS